MRNKLYLLVFLLLLGLNAWLWLGGTSTSGTGEDTRRFALSDTTGLREISFKKSDTLVVLSKQNGRWYVANTWPIEYSWELNLKTILTRQEVRRSITGAEKEQLLAYLEETGITVSIKDAQGTRLEFVAGGNPTRTQSLLLKDGALYAMFVPGFDRFLSSIYEMGPNEWRDRTLYYGNERTLQVMEVKPIRAGAAESLRIDFTGDLPRALSHVAAPLEQIENYLGYLNGLYADVWVPPAEHEKIRLFLTDPLAELIFKDLKEERSLQLRLYDLPEDPRFYLGEIIGQQDYFLIARNRSELLLKAFSK